MPNLIYFATDFGPGSQWVGVCHAVVAAIAPQTRIIDLVHDLTPFDVTGAALILRDIVPVTSPAIAVLVVDPGVGTARRAVAVRCTRGDILVGPDNGLLTTVAQAIGGIDSARELTAKEFQRSQTSSTFHARDIFCPVAAHLSAGVRFEDIGGVLSPQILVAPIQAQASVERKRIVSAVTNIDRFGNARLAVRSNALQDAGIENGARLSILGDERAIGLRITKTYQNLSDGEVGLVEDSYGWLAVVMNGKSAARQLEIAQNAIVEIRAKD